MMGNTRGSIPSGQIALALLFFLWLPGCSAPLRYSPCDADCPSASSGARASLVAPSAAAAVDSSQLANLAPLADAACFPFGAGVPPATDDVYTARGSRGWLSSAFFGAPDWVFATTANLGLSGGELRAGRCAGDKALAATEKGLEWISLKDRSTGVFAAAGGFGSGVTAIHPVDSTHVLVGTGPTGPGAILKCDVTTNTCAATSGFDGRGRRQHRRGGQPRHRGRAREGRLLRSDHDLQEHGRRGHVVQAGWRCGAAVPRRLRRSHPGTLGLTEPPVCLGLRVERQLQRRRKQQLEPGRSGVLLGLASERDRRVFRRRRPERLVRGEPDERQSAALAVRELVHPGDDFGGHRPGGRARDHAHVDGELGDLPRDDRRCLSRGLSTSTRRPSTRSAPASSLPAPSTTARRLVPIVLDVVGQRALHDRADAHEPRHVRLRR